MIRHQSSIRNDWVTNITFTEMFKNNILGSAIKYQPKMSKGIYVLDVCHSVEGTVQYGVQSCWQWVHIPLGWSEVLIVRNSLLCDLHKCHEFQSSWPIWKSDSCLGMCWNWTSFLCIFFFFFFFFFFFSRGIILWIELPWSEKPANTYARHTETLDSCFDLIRFHQQDIQWSPPLKIEPATTDCRAETLQLFFLYLAWIILKGFFTQNIFYSIIQGMITLYFVRYIKMLIIFRQ